MNESVKDSDGPDGDPEWLTPQESARRAHERAEKQREFDRMSSLVRDLLAAQDLFDGSDEAERWLRLFEGGDNPVDDVASWLDAGWTSFAAVQDAIAVHGLDAFTSETLLRSAGWTQPEIDLVRVGAAHPRGASLIDTLDRQWYGQAEG